MQGRWTGTAWAGTHKCCAGGAQKWARRVGGGRLGLRRLPAPVLACCRVRAMVAARALSRLTGQTAAPLMPSRRRPCSILCGDCATPSSPESSPKTSSAFPPPFWRCPGDRSEVALLGPLPPLCSRRRRRGSGGGSFGSGGGSFGSDGVDWRREEAALRRLGGPATVEAAAVGPGLAARRRRVTIGVCPGRSTTFHGDGGGGGGGSSSSSSSKGGGVRLLVYRGLLLKRLRGVSTTGQHVPAGSSEGPCPRGAG